MPVDGNEISLAFDFIDSGPGNAVFIRRSDGKIFWRSDYAGDFEKLPEDIDDEDLYVALPDKRDLDLGSRLVMRFAREELPDHSDAIDEIFSRRGAYRKFKTYLERLGALDRWRAYEEAATEKALREWCAEQGIELAAKASGAGPGK